MRDGIQRIRQAIQRGSFPDEAAISNGVVLQLLHLLKWPAFDTDVVRLHLRPDVLEEHDGPMLRHGLQELHGGLIHVPRRYRDRPNRDYLKERFEKFTAA
jgi:putative restriction endonuclease